MSDSTARSETDVAAMLGICKRVLRRARLAGAVHPRRVGRAFRYSAADIAGFVAGRPNGLNAKQAAAMLGISRTRLSALTKAGKIAGTPAGGIDRIRYVYDPAALDAFRG